MHVPTSAQTLRRMSTKRFLSILHHQCSCCCKKRNQKVLSNAVRKDVANSKHRDRKLLFLNIVKIHFSRRKQNKENILSVSKILSLGPSVLSVLEQQNRHSEVPSVVNSSEVNSKFRHSQVCLILHQKLCLLEKQYNVCKDCLELSSNNIH